MNTEKKEIIVPGQLTGPALLTGYLIKEVSVAPDRKRPAVIVCAGGGYWQRSDRESEPLALQFMAMGCHAFILDYSVAPNHFPTSVRELGEAVAYIREHSAEWKVDPAKIIVCGSSAAGHLACSLGVFWDNELVYDAIGRTPAQIRPDGLILCYPVITGGEYAHVNSFKRLLGDDVTQEQRDAVSLENFVTEQTPRAFIWHTYTDENVPVENSLLLAAAMKRKNVNFELHIYPTGGHGLSLADEETAGNGVQVVEQCQSWIPLVKMWLKHFEASC